MNADCHYGDHTWNGGGVCVRCDKRLRCFCGAFVRADGLDDHLDSGCRWVAMKEREEYEEASSQVGL